MPAVTYDAIVLGVGAMGSAACRELARRGKKVLGLEQFSAAHALGSSHGETRAVRKAYFEHPSYVPLLERAYALWAELEHASGQRLFERCGMVVAGKPGSEVVAGVRRAAELHALALEDVSGADLARRFPGFAAKPELEAVFEPDAGFVPVEASVRVQIELARRHGAEIREHCRVERYQAGPHGVSVFADGQRHEAGVLVVTAGAWSARFLSDLGVPLEPRRKVQLWFSTASPAHELGACFPVFAFDLEHGFFYGFPALEPGVMKIAEHSGGDAIANPDTLERALSPDDVARVRAFALDHLPGVDAEPVRHATCMYTMTPDEHFVIDRHPRQDNVFVAAGFSGHGFKFAPLVGSILADLAIDGRTSEPIEFLSARRFAPK
jgi:sarcosine oxidase